jgi:hypothetical protein
MCRSWTTSISAATSGVNLSATSAATLSEVRQ